MADELAQDALVRVIEHWPQVSAMGNPEGWAYRVAFNLARSRLRRRLAERRAHDRSGRPATTSWNVDVASVLSVRAAVASLAPRQRQAVVLRYYADLPLAGVAEAMGCQTGTVKAHLHQALATLRTAGLVEPDERAAPSLAATAAKRRHAAPKLDTANSATTANHQHTERDPAAATAAGRPSERTPDGPVA